MARVVQECRNVGLHYFLAIALGTVMSERMDGISFRMMTADDIGEVPIACQSDVRHAATSHLYF